MARSKTHVQNHDEEVVLGEEYDDINTVVAGRGGRKIKGGGVSNKKRMRSIYIDDVAEEADEDEEEEDDYDYDEEDHGKGKTKRKQSSAAVFIDNEATVASSDDEGSTEGEEEDGEPFIVSNDDILPEYDDSRRMRHEHRPHLFPDDEEDMEAMERRLLQRYRSYYEEIDEAQMGDVEQQSLLPTVKDSKLWTVRCSIGREREAAVCLMQKCIDRAPGMHIKSAVSLDYLQNYIFVEADKEAHVREACKGIKMLDARKIVLVPIKEMTDVVSAKGKAMDIVKDMWVRMKIGIYKGDIAKVVTVPDTRKMFMVKLIPRVDLQAVADKLEGKKVSKKAFIPSPRLMNLDAARRLNIPVHSSWRERSTGISFDVIDGKTFNEGFLYKKVSMRSVEYQNIQPSFNELKRFRDSEHGDGSVVPTSPANRRKCSFMKGDAVTVVRGDLMNLMGWVEKVEEDNLHIKPNRTDLQTTVVVNEKCVCKYFKLGDHVKVVSGAHKGSTGTVIKVERNVLIILSDVTREDISVLADDVVDSSEVTSGTTTRIGDYELHDLVMLGDMSFGVIIRLEGEALQVLKGDPDIPEVALVKLRDIRYKIERRSTAQDRYRNIVSVKDVVKILTGPYKGKQGPVEHIHRGILFIKERRHMEHSGFICVKAESCLGMGGSHTKLSPSSGCATSRHNACIPPSPRSCSRTASNSGGRPGGVGLRRRDSFVGGTVKILFGPYKGCRGRVVSRNGQSVRVELESQMQTVTFKREEISVDAFSETPQRGFGSETPIRPAQTPLRPYMTPMRDQGGQTPLHMGMRTPMRHQAWNPCAISVAARSPFAYTDKAPALTTVSGWD